MLAAHDDMLAMTREGAVSYYLFVGATATRTSRVAQPPPIAASASRSFLVASIHTSSTPCYLRHGRGAWRCCWLRGSLVGRVAVGRAKRAAAIERAGVASQAGRRALAAHACNTATRNARKLQSGQPSRPCKQHALFSAELRWQRNLPFLSQTRQ